jgi:membrane protein
MSDLKLRLKSGLRLAWSLLNDTVDEFVRDRGDLLAAALAFYTLLSVAPLIIVAVALAGLILGSGVAREESTRLMVETMGAKGAEAVNGWVDEVSRTSGVASFVGVALAVLASSKLAAQLRSALNQVCNVDEYLAQDFKATVTSYVQRRLFAFAAVLASGPLLLLIVGSRALLTGFHDALFVDSPIAAVSLQIMQFLLSLVVVAGSIAIVFRAVPDTHIGWRSVWIGAITTSLLFNLGNLLVGLYLGRATVSAAYGAAGSAVVVLLWIYFSAQLFLFGAEFTQVLSKRFGRGLKPEGEREVGEAARAGAEAAKEGSGHRPGLAGAR